MGDQMRAGQMFGVNDMRCVEAPIPKVDHDATVLIKTVMTSICGSDLHLVCDGVGLIHTPPCPHGYPGHESVGEVVASTDDRFPAGSRVLCFPNPRVAEGFCEYQRVNPKYLLPLPSPAAAVTEAELLMAQQLGTVIYAARKRPVDVAGKTALVLGQGSAGLFWAYWLKRQGAARVIATDLCDARLAASASFGVDVALNVGDVDLDEAMHDLTPDGADYVVEAVGRHDALVASIDHVRPGGDIMWFGLPDSNQPVPLSYSKFFRKQLTATSAAGAQDEGDAASFRTALDLIADGHIDVKPLLSHLYSIEDIDTAFEVANNPDVSGALKVSVSF